MTATETTLTAPSPIEAEIKNQILQLIESITPVSEEEKEAIFQSIEIRNCKKGTILLREGETPNECYMNLKGLVREYYLIDGEEKTTNFYTEGNSISSSLNTATQKPSKYYLECIEDTMLSVSTLEMELEMYRRFPRFESVCRVETEKKLGEYQERLASYITTSPEERYRKLLEERPDLLVRVPQYQLASYIGVKPESLSRIRRRISAK